MFSKLLSRAHLRVLLLLTMVFLPLWLAGHHSVWAMMTMTTGTNDSNQAYSHGSTSISPVVTESGLISVSIDGTGSNEANGSIVQVEKPAGATVRRAYMAATTTGFSDATLSNGDIKIEGTGVAFTQSINNSISSSNYWGDVTNIVKPIVDAAPAGRVDIRVTELDTLNVDGEILAVIFDDPNQSRENSVILLFGAQNVNGDSFPIALAEPIDLFSSNLVLDMGLGISYGCQGTSSSCGPPQFSRVSVNDKQLTSAAGGYDDGDTVNGTLITVGGLDDSRDNPTDPTALPVDSRSDDELYNMIPFVSNGDTTIDVFTINPSSDDNIFFASLLIGGTTAIVGEGIVLGPAEGSSCLATEHTLKATVQDDAGNPVVARDTTFKITSGPHSNTTNTVQTDNNGQATFTYTGSQTGVDTIQASFVDSQGNTQTSHPVSMIWLAEEDCLPPGHPIELYVAASEESVNIDWDLVAPLEGDLDHYDLHRTENGGNETVVYSEKGTSFTDENVTSDVEYCYQVKALDSHNNLIGQSEIVCVQSGQLTLWTPHQVVDSGATNVPVPINLANGDGLCIRALDIKLSYNQTIVEPTGNVEASIFTQGYAFNANTNVPGEIKISSITGASQCVDLYGAGTLFHAYFNVIGGEGSVTSLDFIEGLTSTVIYDLDNAINAVPLVLKSGSLTVGQNFILGDINGDGVVNAVDAAWALDISSNVINASTQQLAACDVNGDQVCNAADSSVILCYAAFQDWNQCLGPQSSSRHPTVVTQHAPSVLTIGTPEQSGQRLLYPVSVSNAADLAGGSFTFVYDASQMTATGASLASLSSDFEIEVNTSQAGLLDVSLASERPINADGVIFHIAFTGRQARDLDFASIRLNDASGRDFESSALQREIQFVSYTAPAVEEHLLYLPLTMGSQ